MKKDSQAWLFVLLIACFANTSTAQIITTFAGNGISGHSGDGGSATAAKIGNPHGGVFDNFGNCYFVESAQGRISKVDIAGVITTYAGTGTIGYNGDSIQATSAEIGPDAICVDSSGNLYIADSKNHRIRKVNSVTGLISTIAGTGTIGYSGDRGAATAALINSPWGICVGKHNDLYFADAGNNTIRRINSSGIINTIIGNGTIGYSGDNGPATAATCNNVLGISINDIGALFFADYGNNRIRKIDTFGVVTTIAGNGTSAYNGDSIAGTTAQLNPLDIRIDTHGNIYIADLGNERIRKIDSSGVIYTIAGTGIIGYNGDDILADTAKIYYPSGLAVDNCGNVYFGDNGNNRFRKISVLTPIFTTPSIELSGITSASTGVTVTITATVSGAGGSYLIHWLDNGIEISTTTTPSVTYIKTASIDTITARIVSTSAGCYDSAISAQHIVTTATTGISVTLNGQPINIYPNPTNGNLYISNISAQVFYQLIDIIGATLQQGTLQEGSNTLLLNALPAGMYLLQLTDEQGGKVVRKIIKE